MKFQGIIIAVAMLVSAFCAASPAQAAASYVVICDAFGPAWEYVPGTNNGTCVNVTTGATKTVLRDNDQIIGSIDGTSPIQQGIADAQAKAEKALDGAAISLAMQPAIITSGHSFAVSSNVGTFEGKFALGLSAATAVNDNVQVNAAFGSSAGGVMAGRAGINISW